MDNQLDFRKGIPIEDAIFKLTNEVLNALNNKTMAGNIFCDLEKAFDSVNHDLILSNLSFYGISKGKAIPLQAFTGPESSRRMRLSDFKTIST